MRTTKKPTPLGSSANCNSSNNSYIRSNTHSGASDVNALASSCNQQPLGFQNSEKREFYVILGLTWKGKEIITHPGDGTIVSVSQDGHSRTLEVDIGCKLHDMEDHAKFAWGRLSFEENPLGSFAPLPSKQILSVSVMPADASHPFAYLRYTFCGTQRNVTGTSEVLGFPFSKSTGYLRLGFFPRQVSTTVNWEDVLVTTQAFPSNIVPRLDNSAQLQAAYLREEEKDPGAYARRKLQERTSSSTPITLDSLRNGYLDVHAPASFLHLLSVSRRRSREDLFVSSSSSASSLVCSISSNFDIYAPQPEVGKPSLHLPVSPVAHVFSIPPPSPTSHIPSLSSTSFTRHSGAFILVAKTPAGELPGDVTMRKPVHMVEVQLRISSSCVAKYYNALTAASSSSASKMLDGTLVQWLVDTFSNTANRVSHHRSKQPRVDKSSLGTAGGSSSLSSSSSASSLLGFPVSSPPESVPQGVLDKYIRMMPISHESFGPILEQEWQTDRMGNESNNTTGPSSSSSSSSSNTIPLRFPRHRVYHDAGLVEKGSFPHPSRGSAENKNSFTVDVHVEAPKMGAITAAAAAAAAVSDTSSNHTTTATPSDSMFVFVFRSRITEKSMVSSAERLFAAAIGITLEPQGWVGMDKMKEADDDATDTSSVLGTFVAVSAPFYVWTNEQSVKSKREKRGEIRASLSRETEEETTTENDISNTTTQSSQNKKSSEKNTRKGRVRANWEGGSGKSETESDESPQEQGTVSETEAEEAKEKDGNQERKTTKRTPGTTKMQLRTPEVSKEFLKANVGVASQNWEPQNRTLVVAKSAAAAAAAAIRCSEKVTAHSSSLSSMSSHYSVAKISPLKRKFAEDVEENETKENDGHERETNDIYNVNKLIFPLEISSSIRTTTTTTTTASNNRKNDAATEGKARKESLSRSTSFTHPQGAFEPGDLWGTPHWPTKSSPPNEEEGTSGSSSSTSYVPPLFLPSSYSSSLSVTMSPYPPTSSSPALAPLHHQQSRQVHDQVQSSPPLGGAPPSPPSIPPSTVFPDTSGDITISEEGSGKNSFLLRSPTVGMEGGGGGGSRHVNGLGSSSSGCSSEALSQSFDLQTSSVYNQQGVAPENSFLKSSSSGEGAGMMTMMMMMGNNSAPSSLPTMNSPLSTALILGISKDIATSYEMTFDTFDDSRSLPPPNGGGGGGNHGSSWSLFQSLQCIRVPNKNSTTKVTKKHDLATSTSPKPPISIFNMMQKFRDTS